MQLIAVVYRNTSVGFLSPCPPVIIMTRQSARIWWSLNGAWKQNHFVLQQEEVNLLEKYQMHRITLLSANGAEEEEWTSWVIWFPNKSAALPFSGQRGRGSTVRVNKRKRRLPRLHNSVRGNRNSANRRVVCCLCIWGCAAAAAVAVDIQPNTCVVEGGDNQ